MKDIMAAAFSTIIDKNLFSKVEGRRNYVIITYDNEFWAMGFGEAARRNLLRWYLKEMAEHGIHFIEFTYKKDFKEAIAVLKDAGMKCINL